MLFRNEVRELQEALYLTQELEKALIKDGAKGFSLSDKIKSYENSRGYDLDDDDDAYRYRQYKRGLLGGYYNDLRWIAHERNQIMHQPNYLIAEFIKFKYTIRDATDYIAASTKNYLRDYLKKALYYSMFLIPVLLFLFLANFYFPQNIFNLDFYQSLSSIQIIIGLIGSGAVLFAFWLGLAYIYIFLMILFDMLAKIQLFISKNKFLFIMSILSIILWNVDLQTFLNLF